MTTDPSDLRIDLVTTAEDIVASFDCTCKTFGHQTHDGIWIAMHPGWDTPDGKAKGAQRMLQRWAAVTRDDAGELNTMFLKATLPDAQRPGERVFVGVAIWVQASAVAGRGDRPAEDLRAAMDLKAVYPGDEAEQRYAYQLDRSLHKRRIEVVEGKAAASPPAVMVLDLCVVDPAFQGKGIAKELVRWGLDEAERRGGLEAITEASEMGRRVYAKLGFQAEGEIEYHVDAEFADRDRPSNVFMRTQK
ncbi:hypothetical protein QQZ08_011357 [Neonectria magnoliae]|uniref:N-acetyltransferase domain-containing protein n=1 Tax=Neonectria magnoliae TaxID=2732573 RepID=A0ABR1HBH3_9HYPO